MVIKVLKLTNYMYISITFLLLSIYVICFPIIAKILNILNPILTKCVYRSITGNDCPLCGGTRYFANISNIFTNPSYILNPFGLIFIFILLEICFRVYIIVNIKKKRENVLKIVKFDVIIHIIALIAFITYEILFFINN